MGKDVENRVVREVRTPDVSYSCAIDICGFLKTA